MRLFLIWDHDYLKNFLSILIANMEKYIDIYAHIHTHTHKKKMAFMKIPKWIFYIDYY